MSGVNFEAYARREDAVEALAAIKPVDCAARSGEVLDRALEACRRAMNMANRRILLVTDQQVPNWSADAEREHLKQLPCPMEIVQVVADQIENVWVNDVQLRDGVANAECPAVFTATIGYQGGEPRKGIPVVLKVDGRQVASQTIDLLPGQKREVVFPEYEFPRSSGSDQTRYATVEVSIAKDKIPFDRLPDDNSRVIVVPVAESLPVVFVDSLGAHEDTKKKIYGDTYWLRRWLAPQSGQAGQDRPLVQVRHVTIDQLSRKLLADARLVVIGGVARPSPEQVTLLEQYVEQGGNLILAAGGNFDPIAWTEAAWKGGLGILPAPLAATALGFAREDRRWATSKTVPLTLNFASAHHQYLRPEGVDDDYLRETLGFPTLFHKIVVAQCDKAVQDSAAEAATKYFGEQREKLADLDHQRAALESAADAAKSQEKIAALDREREKLQPAWLTWKKADDRGGGGIRPVDDLAQRARPAVLASYNNESAHARTAAVGARRSSLPDDELVARVDDAPRPAAVGLADGPHRPQHVVRDAGLVEQRGQREGCGAAGCRSANAARRFTLTDPEGKQRTLSVDALGGDRYGIGLGDLTRRGIYHVRAARTTERHGRRAQPLGNSPGRERAGRGVAARSRQKEPGGGDRASSMPRPRPIPSSPLQLEGVDLWKWLDRPDAGPLAGRVAAGGPFDFTPGGRLMNMQQTIYDWLGRMLGLEQMQSVADCKFSFAASWAQRAPLLLLFGFVGLVAAAAVFYFRHQPNRHRRWRVVLFLIRAAVLCQVLLLLAEPILTLTIQSRKRPACGCCSTAPTA